MANISHLKHCEPQYVEMPGWGRDIGSARRWDDLPRQCRDYIELIESEVGAPVDLIGVGPRRDQFVERRNPWTRAKAA